MDQTTLPERDPDLMLIFFQHLPASKIHHSGLVSLEADPSQDGSRVALGHLVGAQSGIVPCRIGIVECPIGRCVVWFWTA